MAFADLLLHLVASAASSECTARKLAIFAEIIKATRTNAVDCNDHSSRLWCLATNLSLPDYPILYYFMFSSFCFF